MPPVPVSLNTRVSLTLIVVTVPLFVWAGRLDNRVDYLERERAETLSKLQHIEDNKLDDVRSRIPLVRPKPASGGEQEQEVLRSAWMSAP